MKDLSSLLRASYQDFLETEHPRDYLSYLSCYLSSSSRFRYNLTSSTIINQDQKMIDWMKNKNTMSSNTPESSPSPAAYRPTIYPSKTLLIIPLSIIPLLVYSYNVIIPPIIMSIVSFLATVILIPLSSPHLVRAGLRGRDLLKPYKQLV